MLAEGKNIMEGKNVFIEFEIIEMSNPDILYKELDILLAKKLRIYTWSKSVPPIIMRDYCKKTTINIPKEEKERHQKAYDMRYDGATYKDISDATQIPTDQLGWYLSNKPNRQWVLDDWIADYYIKDSSIYQKADAIVDCDEKFVDRFKRRGIPGNVLQPLR